MVEVARIRPEEGLGRRRAREGHEELQRSIAEFGVVTPITVRWSEPDAAYLLIKGQGRTLACRMLGIDLIPAYVVDDSFAENEKVQQFLVENVARLKMRPVERALLVARARAAGEETAEVARRFGITSATVRRLQAQIEGATPAELDFLRGSGSNLALHAVVSKHVQSGERMDVLAVFTRHRTSARDAAEMLSALGWREMSQLGAEERGSRLLLLAWAASSFAALPAGWSVKTKILELATKLPAELSGDKLEVIA